MVPYQVVSIWAAFDAPPSDCLDKTCYEEGLHACDPTRCIQDYWSCDSVDALPQYHTCPGDLVFNKIKEYPCCVDIHSCPSLTCPETTLPTEPTTSEPTTTDTTTPGPITPNTTTPEPITPDTTTTEPTTTDTTLTSTPTSSAITSSTTEGCLLNMECLEK
ncbi:unnamed protein product, partial [Meganyctiphanes norvegica]